MKGFSEPFFIKISPNEFNNIILDSKAIETSKKTFKSISKFKQNEYKKYNKISLLGTWEVIAINKFVNPQWKYLDEIEPNSINRKLNRLFPCELKRG